ncbi:baseplate multidomain protein megatron [Methylocystis iwaonis]|uniref:Host specificity protein n=1 Tax=Methylocystis iwaonis TaxID=2885079 RepID=A0ABM8E7G8_9HYPH|nr:glycoside hydrolase/phage tail family protein [Methylocystis iwaonis]BDV33911.1 hypothetical protein SS37A_14400 [Methylocystis iwaonis]
MATMLFSAVGGSSLVSSVLGTAAGVGLNYAAGLLGRKKSSAPKVTFGQHVYEVHVTGAQEGAPVRRLWGRARIGGQVIWATNFSEYAQWVPSFTQSAASGKGAPAQSQQLDWTEIWHAQISFAVAFCEGDGGTSLGCVWADGKLLDLTKYTWRFYNGSETQAPDPLIVAAEGAAPAYRGICYLVFENMLLDKFGNRIPQITAEIVRRPKSAAPDDLTRNLRSVCMIPATTEFGYATTVYKASANAGSWSTVNSNAEDSISDFTVSLDALVGINATATLPAGVSATGGNWRSAKGALDAADAVSLVVAWFGDDLRAGDCTIRPKVEVAQKNTDPADWEVAGYTRAGYAWFVAINGVVMRAHYAAPNAFPLPWGVAASVVSQVSPDLMNPNGAGGSVAFTGAAVPAYGGTPSDGSVVEAIKEIKRRGLRCVFYPFIAMDVPPGNGKPDPWGGAEQAAFPWRGRITCHPAPGQPGTVDKTAAAATQIAAFFAQYSAMVTHYASLCVSAGGVDAFIIGSELVGLTQVRSSPGDGTYPAVDALKTLAANVRAIVGPDCKIGYAADWSEYHSHRPSDGTHDVIFNMDPLWSDPNIDFIGIDNYMPLADWRDSGPNADAAGANAAASIYDKSYLARNVEGGEYYDWHYASAADRTAQTRTPIADTAYGEHWAFRQKDMRNWWGNAHHSRPGGVRNAAATSFLPGSKPIWFTEFGCPAVDKGANQPNVFVDSKSSESAYPYFSNGNRDDAIQRAFLESLLAYWRDNAPVSAAGVKMLDTRNMFAWAWDARPFPDFPAQGGTWRDAPNYHLGHWLNGRLDEPPLTWILGDICAAAGTACYDASRIIGPSSLAIGVVADGPTSPRDLLEQISAPLQIDAFESGGCVVFASRAQAKTIAVSLDDLVMESADDVGYSLTRAQETDLPYGLTLTFVDLYKDYDAGSVRELKNVGSSQNLASVNAPLVLDPGYAKALTRALLQQHWLARDTGTLKVPPSFSAVEPGDCIAFDIGEASPLKFRVDRIDRGDFLSLELMGFDPASARFGSASAGADALSKPTKRAFGPPIVEFLDLPLATGTEPQPWAPRVAAFASPWTPVAVYRTVNGSNTLIATVTAPTMMGEIVDGAFYSGPRSIWDYGNSLYVQFYGDAQLLSQTEQQVFDGANVVAVKAPSGDWEIVQFAQAELLATNKYKLSKLLRAQQGTEAGMADPVPIGARVVVLTPATLATLGITVDQLGQALTLRAGPAKDDPGASSYFDYSVTPKGVGLRPFSVSQIKGRRPLGFGDALITWSRRTRYGGDAWDPPDVPLSEQSESYDLEVLDWAGNVLRTVSGLASPTWTYALAEQTTDWGGPQNVYPIRVYQISGQIGRGQPAKANVNL